MTVSILTSREAAVARRLWRDRFLAACDDVEACAAVRDGVLERSRVELARAAAGRWWEGSDDG